MEVGANWNHHLIMADLFKNLDAFIAEETVKALSFSPSAVQNPSKNAPSHTSDHVSSTVHRERRPRIVQVLHAQLFSSDCPPYLIISDGTNCVHLFLPSVFFYDDESIPADDVQQHHDTMVYGSERNKAFISRGALIKIRNYTILSLSQCCKDYFSRLQPLPHSQATHSIHPIVCWAIVGCRVLKNKESANGPSPSYLPLIQILGCDGSDIFGNPSDVHEFIDFKRVVRQHTYETMIQRLLACHWHFSDSLITGSYLEWPYLLQKRRINVSLANNTNTIYLDDASQNHGATVLSKNDTNRSNKAVVYDDSRDRDSETNAKSSKTVNTSEQEDLLSMYRSFEISEALQPCSIPNTNQHRLGHDLKRASVGDLNLSILPSLGSRMVHENPTISSTNDCAKALDATENNTRADKASSEMFDDGRIGAACNSCTFATISEMLYDEDGSQESSSSANLVPRTAASDKVDIQTTDTIASITIGPNEVTSNAGEHGMRPRFKLLQKRAKLRKIQCYLIPANDNLTGAGNEI